MSKTFGLGVAAALACCAGTALAQGNPGADIVWSDISSLSNHGVIGDIAAFSLGSSTCNIGTQPLLWLNNGTPGGAMNAYRLSNGRLVQIGMSHVKHACCVAQSTSTLCAPVPTCTPASGQLGVGCLDVYSSGWNSGQTRLGPRSVINAQTGQFTGLSGTTGNAIFKRLQVATADLSATNHPGALYFVEGVYVCTNDAVANNNNNNASYRRVTVSNNSMTLTGATQRGTPAIFAWRDNGLGVGVPDPSVTIVTVDVANDGRFFVAGKATDLGNNTWRYDYAVYNLHSQARGGGFSVSLPNRVVPSDLGFSDPEYHSGETIDNTDWPGTFDSSTGVIRWAPTQNFAQNPNANQIVWGTMYNFWFTARTAPTTGTINLDLFRPNTPQSSSVAGLPVPGPACAGDWDFNGEVEPLDISAFFANYRDGNADADGNGETEPLDITAFFASYRNGC
jgi:hypothetical protein